MLVTGCLGRHCCIKAKGALALHRSNEADPSDALKNHNKPDIRRPATWLLGEQTDQLGWTDRSMQQCPQPTRRHRQPGTLYRRRVTQDGHTTRLGDGLRLWAIIRM